MMLRTNLVILLSAICVVRTLAIRSVTEVQERTRNDHRSRACQSQIQHVGGAASERVKDFSLGSVRLSEKDEAGIRRSVQALSIDTVAREEGLPRRRMEHELEKITMPLLLAYKLKFTALVPVILGGLVVLISMTTLAGFFFALFAAVLGLKAN